MESPRNPERVQQIKTNEDYYSWRDSAVNDLGQAGLIHFLNDTLIIAKSPELATSVFYALRLLYKIEQRTTLRLLSMMTTIIIHLNYGPTSSSGMTHWSIMLRWCYLKSNGY